MEWPCEYLAPLADLLIFSTGSVWTSAHESRLQRIPASERDHVRRREFRKVFDQLSNKRFIDLYSELKGRDISIDIDPKTGWALRNAKTVRAVIRNPEAGAILIEESRTYLNGETIENYKAVDVERWSFSETIKLHETPFDCLLRGLSEELGFNSSQLKKRKLKSVLNPIPDVHPSKAYKGVLSTAVVYWFTLDTLQLDPNLALPKKRDSGVTLNRGWYDEHTGERIERFAT
jgi:hypothetical protein